ncbi:TPA: hypothetical protein ACJW4O_004805, partial [Salmonella enterica subsp. enterica serovar Grumpensis]
TIRYLIEHLTRGGGVYFRDIFTTTIFYKKTFHLNIIIKFPTAGGGYTAPPCRLLLPFSLRSPPWLFTTAAGVVWDRLPTADPGGPATISS